MNPNEPPEDEESEAELIEENKDDSDSLSSENQLYEPSFIS